MFRTYKHLLNYKENATKMYNFIILEDTKKTVIHWCWTSCTHAARAAAASRARALTHQIFRSEPLTFRRSPVAKVEVDPLCYFRKTWTRASSLSGRTSTQFSTRKVLDLVSFSFQLRPKDDALRLKLFISFSFITAVLESAFEFSLFIDKILMGIMPLDVYQHHMFLMARFVRNFNVKNFF